DIYAADAMVGILSDLAASHDADDWALEAACCKVFASEMLWRSADELVQVAGGRGYVKPYLYERWLRDSRINRIFEGTNEILRLFIALNGIQGPAERLKEIGSALRKPVRNLGLISGFAASRLRSALGATPTLDVAVDERLTTHKKYFEKHVAELHAATERGSERARCWRLLRNGCYPRAGTPRESRCHVSLTSPCPSSMGVWCTPVIPRFTSRHSRTWRREAARMCRWSRSDRTPARTST